MFPSLADDCCSSVKANLLDDKPVSVNYAEEAELGLPLEALNQPGWMVLALWYSDWAACALVKVS